MVLSVSEVESATGDGRLVDPEDLVEDLLLSSATDYERRRVLLGQVGLGRQRRDYRWLETCAGFCFQLGFGMMSPEWTEEHVAPIPDWARSNSGRPYPRWTTRSGDKGATGISGSLSGYRSAGISSRTGVRARSPDVGWQVVTNKRARRRSPVEWEQEKVIYDPKVDEECFKCGEKGHYARQCEGSWKCFRCGRLGHRAFACFGARQPREPATGISSSGSNRSDRIEGVPEPDGSSAKVSVPHPEEAQERDSREPITGISGGVSQKVETRSSRAKKAFRRCRVSWCNGNFSYKKAHTFDSHFPTALAAQEGTDTRTPLRIEALGCLAQNLVGKEASLDDLVDYVNHILGWRDPCMMDAWTTGVAREVAESLGIMVPEKFTCTPLNSPGCIFQYQVWLDVMNRLTTVEHGALMKEFSTERNPILEQPAGISCTEREQVCVEVVQGFEGRSVSTVEFSAGISCPGEEEAATQASISCLSEEGAPEDWMELESVSSEEVKILSISDSVSSPSSRPWRHERSPQSSVSDLVVVDEVGSEDEQEGRVIFLPEAPFALRCVDTHFHLDRLCHKLRIRPCNYQKAMDAMRPSESLPPVVDSAVAVWCDPETYPSKAQVDSLRKQNVVSTIGIHPSKVREGSVAKLEEMLDTYDVVGVGEVGLDGTHGDPHLQRLVLEETLRIASRRQHLVLVLHCRPRQKELNTHAYYELFYTCKGILPPEQKIHLHCFNGTADVVTLWLGYFPNTYFGFSLMVNGSDFGADSRLALARVDDSRVLLETDAPYFPQREEGFAWSSPAFIGVVADAVGRVRGARRQELLELTAANAQRLYWG